MNDDDAQLRRARMVVDNLAARVGALTAENLELLARLYDYEHPDPDPDDGADGGEP
jgi:hypothetical protein